MKKAFEEIIVDALKDYMKATGIKQKRLAEMLGWSPQDLNDALKGRKAIGAYRMRHIMDTLGESFSQDFLRRLGGKKKLSERVTEAAVPYLYRNDIEKIYVEKLFEVLRGSDEQSIIAVKACIDMGYRLRNGKPKIDHAALKKVTAVKLESNAEHV